MRVRKILVPIDFSPESMEVVAQAVALARRHAATLTLLHVIDITPPEAQTYCGPANSMMKQLWTSGREQLLRLAESLEQQGVQTRTLILEGLPAEVIIDSSAGFDTLVIGQHRRTSAWNLFARHTARRVINHAHCPVLVASQKQDRQNRLVESSNTVTN